MTDIAICVPPAQVLFFPMEQDPVHQLVLRALRGSEVVVANPATIPKAIEKGVPITVTLPLSDEAAINKLFEQCRERALVVASKLLPCPISDTPILYLYDQIRLCMLFNLNGAAITFLWDTRRICTEIHHVCQGEPGR